jgi:hypothetical protein
VAAPKPDPAIAAAAAARLAAERKAKAAARRKAWADAWGSFTARMAGSIAKLKQKKPAAKVGATAQPAAAPWAGAPAANKRMARHAAWAALGIASVAVGAGGYLYTRPDASQADLRPVVPAVAESAPRVALVPETPAEPSAETLQALAQVAAEAESLRNLQALVQRERVKETRELAKLRDEERKRKRKEDEEARKVELANRKEEQRRADEARKQELLAAAKQEYDKGRLYEPLGSSAADRYRDVLKMDPAQPDAVAGLKKVSDLLAAEADRSLKLSRATNASSMIGRLRALQPQHPQLAELEVRLQMIQGAPPAELAGRQQKNLKRGEAAVAKAIGLLDRGTPLSLKDLDTATDAYKTAADVAPDVEGLDVLRERLVVSFAATTKSEWDNNDVKNARKTVDLARKNKLFSPELEQWDATIKASLEKR